ncbi:GNAT family N-acetyltransferase [Paenibacillus sp. N10]|uniref:Lysine N-acyltransferase MbtK n=1 Tax=Paenibacillus lutrae TaxID=2078573 RepID=A0A7X3FLF3_9BACL|nr:GNAT family N-acetyltransferase [Paenibacillus lutrae]
MTAGKYSLSPDNGSGEQAAAGSNSSAAEEGACAFQLLHPGLNKTISFRPVSLERDVELLHSWQQEAHVIPYWNLNVSREQYDAHLRSFLADTHQTLYLGLLDGTPVSYFEAYWTRSDVIGRHYEAHPADQGVHLLIGPPEYTGKGYALPLLQAMVAFLFRHADTLKIIAEPDIRNGKMIHIFEKCGFVVQKEVTLPDKKGALMFLEREIFSAKWKQQWGQLPDIKVFAPWFGEDGGHERWGN